MQSLTGLGNNLLARVISMKGDTGLTTGPEGTEISTSFLRKDMKTARATGGQMQFPKNLSLVSRGNLLAKFLPNP